MVLEYYFCTGQYNEVNVADNQIYVYLRYSSFKSHFVPMMFHILNICRIISVFKPLTG